MVTEQRLTVDWRTVCQHLKRRQYTQAAEFLQEAQGSAAYRDDAIVRDILTAAHRICLACHQCRAETRWLKQAGEEADQREQELRQELYDILDLVSRGETSETWTRRAALPAISPVEPASPERDVPEPGKGPGLLQRIKRRLGRRSSPLFSPAQKAFPREDEAPSSPPPPNGTVPAGSPVTSSTAQKPGSPSLTVYCLGPFRVYLDDQLITNWSGGKGKAIFKYLVANRNRPIAKDILMDLLWPEADAESARNNLNVAIYALRQAFRAICPDVSCILFQDDHYLLNPILTVWVDFGQFVRCYQAARNFEKQGKPAKAIREYEQAEGLYQGDFLEGDPYEDWPILQRESLKDSYLVILDRLCRYYLEQKRFTTGIHLCQKILARDDCREDAHRRLMRCYSRRGQPHLALRQYHLCVEALTQVLDVSPAPETIALYHQIRNGEAV